MAQPSIMESEPNNTPADAMAVSGSVNIMGALAGGDQDAFLWTVSDVDATKRWTFELSGVPGRLTIVEIIRLQYADNGKDITGKERIIKFGTRDGLAPSILQDLLFEPGEYVLGIAGAGGGGGAFRPPQVNLSFNDDGGATQTASVEPGAYRLLISEGRRLPIKNKAKPRASRDNAMDMRLGAEFAALTLEPESWYRFHFDDSAATQLWDITAQVPLGQNMKARLVNAAGETLATTSADNHGKLIFPDLAPSAGDWWVELTQKNEDGVIQSIGSERAGQRVSGEEAEPNGEWRLANRVDLSQPLSGKVGKTSEWDYFRFTLSEDFTDQVLNLALENATTHKLEFCLHDGNQRQVQCRKGPGNIELPDLLLTPGEWGLSVSRGITDTAYTIRLSAQGTIDPGIEAEPNDAIAYASSVPANQRINGRFSGNEDDYFRFVITGKPQLWRFQVTGEGIAEVGYLDASGHQSQRVRPQAGQKLIRLDNVYLLPGVHHLLVRGKNGGQYTLLARAVGQPDINTEREPNDDARHMQRLAIGQTRTGLLADVSDSDYYGFFLANWDHIRITLQPPPDGSVLPSLYWYTHPMKETAAPELGKTITLEGVFPPGDYYLALHAWQTSIAEYSLKLERLQRYACAVDCEPNDSVSFANPIPPDLVLEGVAGDWRDHDFYALPVREEPTEWRFTPTPYRDLKLVSEHADHSLLTRDAATGVFTAMVPAGEAWYLQVSAGQSPAYRIELDDTGRPKAAASTATLPLQMTLVFDTTEVAAYRREGQWLKGELALSNLSTSPQALQLEAAVSDHRWAVNFGRDKLTLASGAETVVPMDVVVPADVWADQPIRISARAIDATGAQSETFVEMGAGREAPVIDAHPGWDIPDALRGGFNVAWSALGSHLVGEYGTDKGTGFEALFNGIDVSGRGLTIRGGWSSTRPYQEIIIELAGGKAIEVAGTAINLFNSTMARRNLRTLDLALSLDGKTFTPVLRRELLPIRTEQYFALDAPVQARFAQLRLAQTYNGGADDQINLGEWKIIARPGEDISDGKGYNLADLELGGHIVYARPPVTVDWDRPMLHAKGDDHYIRLKDGQALEFVVGFNHNRAAQITHLEWIDSAKAKPQDRFSKVTVAVSLESPFGPWKTLGTWDLSASPPFDTTIMLGGPTWARFVKFTAPQPDQTNKPVTPYQIRIWERATGDDYRSILAEWGYASTAAIYEELHPVSEGPSLDMAGNETRERAAPLHAGQAVQGTVALGKWVHWYRITMPAGQNTLALQVTGDPTVRTVLRLEADDEQQVPIRQRVDLGTHASHHFEAVVEPGASYYLQVEEPPRNVMFSWDTSASVNPYLPTVYNALIAFAEDVVPGRDAINLIPFGRGPLLRDWYGEPYILQTVLNDYLRGESASDAERTLRHASQALAPLAGTKAIVVITDATTPHDASVWDEFERVRPRVFGIGVGGGGSADQEQDRFQDWSDVNGGYYKHVVYEGEMAVAYDRVATMLRRPAEYRLQMETGFTEHPGPGFLSVLDGTGSVSVGKYAGAVELVLDASGSMLQRIGGKRRSAIAREVLTQVVEETIPPGTPTALRVFGHQEPSACRTDLVIPLAPLDPAKASKVIANIEARNLAKTPIADSLKLVASDLAAAKGRKIVVLVTDGEETCDGKPEEVIQELHDKGIDITLNIVGFAIDDDELENQFSEWAKTGGGQYFSATDQEDLNAAINTALQTPFTVYDSNGTRVASGRVGGKPVELDAGYYQVVVDVRPKKVFEKVEVLGADRVVLRLD